MSGIQTVMVEYVGLKPSETDHLYGTNITWTGQGDVKPVPSGAWQSMKKHNDVWREVVAQQPAALAPAPTPAPAAQGAGGAAKSDGEIPPPPAAGGAGPSTPTPPDYSALDKAELVKLGTDRKLEFDGRIAKAEIIKLLVAADAAAAAAQGAGGAAQGSQEPAGT